jgi:hypothetical protein
MSPNYSVKYAFQAKDADTLPEDRRWGFGTIPINTDEEPTTPEQFMEIQRHIGITGGHAAVQLLDITKVDHETSDTGAVLEGEIVID